MFSKEAIEQRKAYLEQAEAVARELDKLTIASVRTLGYLGEDGPDKKLLDAIQRKSPGTVRNPGAILRKCSAQALRSILDGRRYGRLR
jgi:hypothetical protein